MSFYDLLFCERAYWIYAVIIYILSLLVIVWKIPFDFDSYKDKDDDNNFQVKRIKIENKFCIQGLCK
jgi:hypothetical protein